MKILESGENYLETIYALTKRNGTVRSVDVATELGFSKPSVSVAMKNLRESGHILVEKGHIKLTDKGLNIAIKIAERHDVIKNFFIHIGVDEATASKDACLMEHDISETSFLAIKAFLESV